MNPAGRFSEAQGPTVALPRRRMTEPHHPSEPSPGPEPRPQLDDPADLFPPPHEASEGLSDLLPPHPPERSVIKRVIYIVVGVVLILIGTVIWITPIIGGAPLFWIPGLIFLAKASDPMRRLINVGDRKLPGKLRTLLRWARDKTGAAPTPAASAPGDAESAGSAKTGETAATSPPPGGGPTPNA